MTMYRLVGSPLSYCLHKPAREPWSLTRRVPDFQIGKSREINELLHLERNYWTGSMWKCNMQRIHLMKCAMDSSYRDMTNDSNCIGAAIFPRINMRDPYKRLGISKEASEEEVQAARNFLLQKYAVHQPSVEAIEAAHDKIIMQQLNERKKPKINIKKKVRDVIQSPVIQAVVSRFRTPSVNFIITTSIAFIILGTLTVLFPTEEGPTLQVAISLIATIYFIYNRLKSKRRAFLYGAGVFILSWLLGTFLMVSVIPPILKGARSLEVTTSLTTYVLLWVSSTYLI